jgi:hypothetical protein
MKRLRVLFILLVLSCNDSNKPQSPEDAMLHRIIDSYNADERRSLDSVKKFGLTAAYNQCLRYMYVIFGDETVIDDSLKHSTIGENNIKLIRFKRKSDSVAHLTFDVFLNDSIPTSSTRLSSVGNLINSFDIDMDRKLILNGSTFGEGIVRIQDIQTLYDSAMRSAHWKQYVDSHENKLHIKFQKLLK